MRNRGIFLLLALFTFSLLVAGCAAADDAAPKAVEAYLQALVAEDGDRLINLSCAAWEQDATMELDSFMGVSARLEELSCEQQSMDDDTAQVICSGAIVATYNNEDRQMDLNVRTYDVVKEGGEWRVCGYH